MSKRPNEEAREERWLRKMKMYEEKIMAKRRRQAERENCREVQVQCEQRQSDAPVPRDVQNEGAFKLFFSIHPNNVVFRCIHRKIPTL